MGLKGGQSDAIDSVIRFPSESCSFKLECFYCLFVFQRLFFVGKLALTHFHYQEQ